MNIVQIVIERSSPTQLNLYYQNYMEDGTVSATSESASFPLYRLYDRAQGLLFKGTSHPNPFQIFLDQGAAGPYPEIDTCIFGGAHNLTGLTVSVSHSDNGADWTQDAAWVATTGINRQSFTGSQHRWWVFSIAAPTADPEIGELFFTKEFHFEANPKYDYGYRRNDNVNRVSSKSRMTQKTKWGNPLRIRNYTFTCLSDTERSNLESLATVLDGIKNFYFEDFESNLFLAEIIGDVVALQSTTPSVDPLISKNWDLSIQIQEVLD